ncbi:monodehydroascorbate reductase [Tanacetum coccineum]
MADVNVNAPAKQAPAMAPPTRTDDQILPRIRWVPIGKSKCYLDVERSQSNPIYKIVVDILDCQLDEKWFDLTKDTLRDALQITPVDTNNAFSSPPTPDALIKFVNDLDYPRVGLKDQGLQCYRFFGALSIEPISIMQRGCGKNSPNPSILLLKTQRIYKHKFYPRLGSPLHLPNEESVLRYLKFSAKGTKWEVFGMPIPNDLITNDIRGKQYYNAYLQKVAKHQRYLAGKEVSDPNSPSPKPAKATKPKASKQSNPLTPKTATNKPKPAPAKPQEKKRKLVTETFEAPSPAKRSKDENEPRIGDEEADLQKAVEESLKEVHSARQGLLPPVVIREPESVKFQPLHEDSETDSDEEVPGIVARVQDEGQAGPNPGEHDEGQAGPNPDDAEASQPPSSHVVHAGPNLEHMDLEAFNTSIQPNPEQMDEEFTITAYPNVQENLKLPTEGEVRLEEPASSAGTLSSLQNLDKELSFADQFLVDKSQEDEPEKTNTELEVQSMVTVPIH